MEGGNKLWSKKGDEPGDEHQMGGGTDWLFAR